MKHTFRAILFTFGVYILFFLVVFLAEKLYTPHGANDITGPPYIVFILGIIVILLLFFRSIYRAFVTDKFYWIIVLLHILLLLTIVFTFFI